MDEFIIQQRVVVKGGIRTVEVRVPAHTEEEALEVYRKVLKGGMSLQYFTIKPANSG